MVEDPGRQTLQQMGTSRAGCCKNFGRSRFAASLYLTAQLIGFHRIALR